MNKKATRLFSMLLAVLMVLTVMPVIALSAAESAPGADSADITVWDGKVPTDSNGVSATVEEWVFGTGAATGAKMEYLWADLADHVERDDTAKTLKIKTAAGFAWFVAWSNVNSKMDSGEYYGTDEAAKNGGKTVLQALRDYTISLEADIYLNDPAVYRSTWTNTVMPIFWDNLDLLNADHWINFTFDGKGHMIYGWKVDQTIVYDETNCQNNAWGLFGQLPLHNGTPDTVIKNLALIAADFDLNATIYSAASTIMDEDDTIDNVVDNTTMKAGVCTLMIGGIYGHVLYKEDIIVENCVVDIDQNVIADGTGSATTGPEVQPKGFMGGITGHVSIDSIHYAEEKAVSGYAKNYVADKTLAGWRVARNCLLFVNQQREVGEENWGGGIFCAAVAADGYSSHMYLDDIIVAEYTSKGSVLDDLTGKQYFTNPLMVCGGSGHTNNRGLIVVEVADDIADPIMTNHESNKAGVTTAQLLNSFETDIPVALTGARGGREKSFITWDIVSGQYPLPMAYSAADFMRTQLITKGITLGEASDYLENVGVSIRVANASSKQGIRFEFQTTEELELLAENADVVYGALVAPTQLVDDELDIDDEVALIYANIEGENIVTLDVVNGNFKATLVNFEGVAGDAFCLDFTVRGFVIVNGTVLYLDAYTASVTRVAKAYIEMYGENPEKADTIAKIEAMLGDHLAE